MTGDAVVLLGVLWVGLTLYALLGGADFGGGVWDLLATGRSRERQREAVGRAIAPVWEANHVWLIFVITGLFAAFPHAFEVLSVALYVPFSLALAGIVFRGAAFVFRSHGDLGSRWRRTWTQVFGVASLITPLLLGASAGAIAAGRIRVRGAAPPGDAFESWVSPLPAATGVLALAVCAYLAATYLTVEAVAAGDRELEDVFRHRALASGVVAGVLALGGLLVVRQSAPILWAGMLRRGLPFVLLSAAGGLVSLVSARARRYRIARAGAAVAVAAVLAAWGAAQWPYLIVPDVRVMDAAAPPAALRALSIGFGAGAAVLAPSLLLLFRVFKAARPSPVRTSSDEPPGDR